MDIQTDPAYLLHDRLLFACGSALRSPNRSVTHELRLGAGRSILTNGGDWAVLRQCDKLTLRDVEAHGTRSFC
jgi:hypothetical protein